MANEKTSRQMGPSMDDIRRAAQEKQAAFMSTQGRAKAGLPGIGRVDEEIVIPERRTVSEETAKDLQRLHAAQTETKKPTKEDLDEKKRREALQREEEESDKKTQAVVDEALRAMSRDEVVQEILDSQYPQNPFLDPSVIRSIEPHLAPLDIGAALFGRATQTVPVLPGQIEVDFQSVKAHESLLMEQILRETANETVRYYTQYSVILLLAVSVKEIRTPTHTERLPSLVNDAGVVTLETLRARAAIVQSFSVELISLLSAHYLWFEGRVRKLLTPQAIKNG